MGDNVRYWFEQAVNLPVSGRVTFLESNCHDESVRSEVLSLLKYDVDDDSTTAQDLPVPNVVRDVIAAVLSDSDPVIPAQRVGPFELGRLLGSGGMGFVYEGQRVDGEVRQRVAVKFAQVSATATPQFRENAHRRFHRERQMLASLRHPYIAGLIDAGTTEAGLPYAVIEQVDGVAIDAYCDASLPDQSDRIRLVLKLCDAVQFAHRNLIVHSDIKPDNVLVTADGIPKLIDFGVASDLGEDTTLNTMRGFTPGYASPELSRGVPATVATDVYGLGAVLYRLLTGAKPREVKNASLEELIRHISEEDVVRPSLIKPELKGDLENIVLKALQREPQRRYGSVPELADDLNRFLARRPVRATPDSALYRTKRLIRRHWAPLVAAAVFVIALATATVVAIQQRHKAVEQAQETRRLAERLLFEVHDEIERLVGGTKAREKVGAIAVQFLERLERHYGPDPDFAWELLSAYSRLGKSRGGPAASLGDSISGSQLAAKTLQLGAIVEAASPNDERLDKLFDVYKGIVSIFEEAGETAPQRETIDRMQRLAARLNPLREAQALNELARYQDANGSKQEASATFERALAILRTLSQSPSKPPETDSQLTSTLVSFGRVQGLAGDFSGSENSLQEAVRRSETSTATDPHLARSARALYWSHIALGDVLGSPMRFNLGRPKEAVEHYQKAHKIAEKLMSADPENDVAKLDLARAFSREGNVLATLQPARALSLLEDSYLLVLRTSSRNHAGLESRFDYLTSSIAALMQRGDAERAQSQISEARGLLKELQRKGLKVNERSLLKAEAIRLFGTGRPREALAEAQRHLSLLPEKTNAVLGDNFEPVDVLERIRSYSAGLDVDACRSATERLARIWQDLRSLYPQSSFVTAQVERAQSLKAKGCTLEPARPLRASKL